MIDKRKEICSCGLLREDSSFHDWADYDIFCKIARENTSLKEVPVGKTYGSSMLDQVWYQCVQCGDIWQLVEPDPPFSGAWELVGGEDHG